MSPKLTVRRAAVAGVALALVLVTGLSGLSSAARSSPPIESSPAPSTLLSQTPGARSPQTCQGNVLTQIVSSPPSANVSPLEDQEFVVSALNGCGTPLTQPASFSWWLSSPSLGLLNSSDASTVAYTACLAPMSGVLHVAVTSGGITLYANSSIAVTLQNPGWESSGSGASSGDPGGAGSSTAIVHETLELGVVLLAVGGVALLLHGRRKPA